MARSGRGGQCRLPRLVVPASLVIEDVAIEELHDLRELLRTDRAAIAAAGAEFLVGQHHFHPAPVTSGRGGWRHRSAPRPSPPAPFWWPAGRRRRCRGSLQLAARRCSWSSVQALQPFLVGRTTPGIELPISRLFFLLWYLVWPALPAGPRPAATAFCRLRSRFSHRHCLFNLSEPLRRLPADWRLGEDELPDLLDLPVP